MVLARYNSIGDRPVILRLGVFFLMMYLFVPDAHAANQLGTITASGPFKFRGVSVPATAAQSLPLVSGDDVETGSATAIILLQDGSRVTIDKNSKLKIQREHDEIVLCLDQGALQFNVVAGSRLTICALGRPVQVRAPSEGTVSVESAETVRAVARTGSVQIEENQTCGCEGQKPWLTKKKAVVLIGTAGAAATGISIAVTRSPAPPPPRSLSAPQP